MMQWGITNLRVRLSNNQYFFLSTDRLGDSASRHQETFGEYLTYFADHREVQGRIDCKQNSHMYLMAISLPSGKALPHYSINDQPVPLNYDTVVLLALTCHI